MRITERKKRILDLLSQSSPSGVCLLNELRVKCGWDGEFRHAKSRKSDQRKSFNRTVSNFDALHTHQIAENRKGFYTNLSAGLFARCAIWELIEEGYLSNLPEPDEIEIAVGRDACTAFVKLKHGQFAVVGTAVFMSDITIVASRPIEEADLQKISQIPWPVQCFKEGGVKTSVDQPVSELVYLPSKINLNGKTEISTAKKKFRLY
jgi:hypothetical protein